MIVSNPCPKAVNGGYMTAFMATLEGVMKEECVKRFESGPNVLELISCISEKLLITMTPVT